MNNKGATYTIRVDEDLKEGPVYFTLNICGMEHSVILYMEEPYYKTFCGLPVTSSMTNNIRGHHAREHIEKPDFCEICYDAMALSTLADI